MKTLVWPDVHHRTRLLESFLAKSGDKFDKRIFLGDWFDAWNDRPDDAARTARLLAELMEDSRNVFIEGNHDTAYRYGTPVSLCSGFTFEKKRFIDNHLRHHHWKRFKLFEIEQGFFCSHAGLHPSTFEHPVLGIDIEHIKKFCDEAQDCCRANIWHPVYDLGKIYDGQCQYGGITWLRWSQFEPIPGLNQIVGHSIRDEPEVSYSRIKTSKHNGKELAHVERVKVTHSHFQNYTPKAGSLASINFNLDTNNKYFATIEDGNVDICLTLDYL
jgi:hypothetical protein